MTLRTQARVAGLLYLVVGISGGFSLGYVVPLGASAEPELVQWGVLADFLQLGAFLGLVALLRKILGGTDSWWGEVMTSSVAVSVGLMAAGDAAAVAGLFEARAAFITAAQVFFGLWLVPLGVLGWTSGRLPPWLSVLLGAAALAYLVDVVLTVLGQGDSLHGLLSAVPAVAEVATLLFLLIVGVQKKESDPKV